MLRLRAEIHPSSKVTFENAQNLGMFSIRDRIISVPMIAENLFNTWTDITQAFIDLELDTFRYGWNEFEYMAMAALRCG